ncbi:hypothetical protein [Zoogloea sp. LCSB751]|uniref:hypothetical protein n=1 Tax=Zoogloea sp. LCSB751 TaxID=1965277 RepID=UPI0011174887|nr:hypothetical protein [Zoogloea sp. LCSB751]
MSMSIPAVIHKAMRSHDGEAVEWLKHIKELQQTPGGRLHLKALQMAQMYLEELIALASSADQESQIFDNQRVVTPHGATNN